MKKVLSGKGKCRFRRSSSIVPFTDGFRVDSSLFKNGFDLQRFLKDFDLNVKTPRAPNNAGSRFVQLAGAPYDIPSNHLALQKAAIAMKERQKEAQDGPERA